MADLRARRTRTRIAELTARWRRRILGPRPIIDRLTVTQHGRSLELRLCLVRGIRARCVWIRDVDSNAWLRSAEFTGEPGNGRRRRTELALIELLGLPLARDEAGTNLALYVEIERILLAGSATAQRLAGEPDTELLPARQQGYVLARSRHRLGRARHTELVRLHTVSDSRAAVTPYVSSGGALSVAVDRSLDPFGTVHVRRLAVRRGRLRMQGRVDTRHGTALEAQLVLKARTSGARVVHPVALEPDPRRTCRRFGHYWYSFRLRLDCARLLTELPHSDDIYDAWFRLSTAQHSEPFDVRVGRTGAVARYVTRSGWAAHGNDAVAVSPYYTFKRKLTSFNINFFATADLTYLRRQLRLRGIIRLLNRRRDIWLVGERRDTAQDNGYWFFRHLRENHPEVDAYYVIAADAPDRSRVAALGNTVDFGSREHVRLALLARRIACSHHPNLLFPVRAREFDRAVRATRIFLQHGVMGTKWMASLYGSSAPGFEADLFAVSSEREREYIITDFGYSPDQIAITGLPRFDSLFAGDVAVRPQQLLIMPTWRDWLQDADSYAESEYHQSWLGLLEDPQFRVLVEAHRLDVVFCLHPNMRQYQRLFDGVPARVISQSDVDVQRLLKQSAMLLTDYSSVGFDFSFLGKPVAYFQFDRERFLGGRGSHLDLDEELPGPVLRSAASTLAELRAQVENGFAVDPSYTRRARRFLAHHDRGNSERVYEWARRARRRRHAGRRLAQHELVLAVRRRLRRHRLYFPVMRRAFTLMKLLPADSNMVFFESGNGRQYGDSPRYIYEELVRKRPEMVKVWAYSGRLPTADANTRVVRRLSPAYYFYLARARFWVNNQSFPHYIRRRRDGVFVQTWHGTPLKRMANDQTVARPATAATARATTAAAQWTVLVSPNPFATRAIRSAYKYGGEVLEVGYPRNDPLHRPDRDELAARVRTRLGIRPEQRVVLYAPTFRDDQTSGGRYTFDLPFDLDRAHEALGDATVLLLRLHSLIRMRIGVPPHLRDHVRDVSSYPDMQELLLISDVLVTDYSSVLFDYATLRRPMLFYPYDLEVYRDDVRGFYLDYEAEVPGPILRTEGELLYALRNLAHAECASPRRVGAFLERFASGDDGQAAERVVGAVFFADPRR